MQPGQAVIWSYTPRGGYGYVIPVPATVVRTTPRRVVIRALHRSGEWREVTVKPEKVKVREG